MIEALKQIVKERRNEDVEIISIFKTGSHLFCTNCKDIDYVVIVDKPIKRIHYFNKDTNEDFFIYSQEERNRELNFETNTTSDMYAIIEVLKPQFLVYGDATVRLDLISKASEYKTMLKNVLEKWCFSPHLKCINNDLYCHKKFWWVILGLKFIENKSYEITTELKDIIQQCHDGVLPKDWEDWVKEKIYN